MAAILLIATFAAVCAAGVFATFRWYLPILIIKNTISEEEGIISLPELKFTEKFRTIFLTWSVLVAGVCGYFAYIRCDELTNIFKVLLAMLVLNIISVIDIELYKIPNLCVISLLAGRCVTLIPELLTWSKGDIVNGFFNSLIAAVIISLFLIFMSIITRGGIGHGDIKLFGALGFLCGLQAVIYTLMLSFLLCAIVSAILLGMKKKHLKDGLAMGPFIWLGFAFTVILGVC